MRKPKRFKPKFVAIAIVGLLALGGVAGYGQETKDDAPVAPAAVERVADDRVAEAQPDEGADNANGVELPEANSDDPTDSGAVIPSEPVPAGSSLTVTFLDVGQGDAAFVECDGKWMLIDGGPPDASSKLYSFCQRNGISTIDYVVATHPDTDHTGGISGALQTAKAGRAFCSEAQSDKSAFNDMLSRLTGQGVKLEVPKVGDSWKLGAANVQVIGPATRTADGDTNNDSIMLKVTYGSTVFVFAGDADAEEEKGAAKYLDGCDVLKVAHHGSAGSSCYAFLRAAMPKNAVISCSASNSYGHPTDDALSRLRDCGAKVFRTDMQGDVVARSDGKAVTVEPARNAGADTLAAGPGGAAALSSGSGNGGSGGAASSDGYIGNKNSKKFHRPTCKTLPADHNRVHFDTRDAAISAGYVPCKNCNP